MEASLRVDDLSKRLARRSILQGLSFELAPGTVAGLVGRIGAGKTTLLSILAGLRQATTGTVSLGDHGPTRGTVAFVDQAASLPRRLNLLQLADLVEGLQVGFDRQRYLDLVDTSELSPRQRIGRLSDGQRKLVAIAEALARHPRVLLLDEPLASLDPLTRHHAMAEVLATAHEERMIVVLSSHLVTDLGRDCDHLLLLRDGRLAIDGALTALLRQHAWHDGPAPSDAMVLIDRGVRKLIRTEQPDRDCEIDLEDLVIAYLGAQEDRT